MSKFKVVFAKFLSKFWLIFFWFYMTQYMLSNSFPDQFNNIFFSFSSLFISFCCNTWKNWKKRDKNSLFKREDKSCIIIVKSNRSWWYYVSCHSQHILSHKVVESKENFIKIWTKIEQKQHWILTFFFWGFYLEYYSYFGCL